jgi:hypothetical protein
MKQTKCYISGRISGLEKSEYEQNFIDATISVFYKMKICKYINVVDPCKIKPLFGIKSYWFHMAADIYHELKCTHVAFQKNWVDSKGARIEMIVAILFNKKIIML